MDSSEDTTPGLLNERLENVPSSSEEMSHLMELSDIPYDSELVEEDWNVKDVDTEVESVPVIDIDLTEDIEEDTENLAEARLNALPLSKIKKLMRADANDDLLVNREALHVTTIAAELFISYLTQVTGKITQSSKKKTMVLPHLKVALSQSECFDFLDGTYPEFS